MKPPNLPPNLKEFLDLQQLLTDLATIPAHNPTRYETTDGLDSPSCTNGDRVSFAAAAVDCFQQTCGMTEDLETAAADLICDLRHLLHANNQNPLPTLRNGIQAFLCEAGKIKPSV